MLQTAPTPPGLLFGSFLYRSDLFSESQLLLRWSEHYGEDCLIFHPEFNPLFEYYAKEMGPELKRFFVISKKLLTRDYLLQTKLQTLKWEIEWSVSGKRMVNVDVGMLTLENFILATTKNYSHRVFIGHDIFADLTFQFQKGKFQSFPWSYPDYLDEKKIDFLTQARSILLKML